jgi:2-polyprenyl-3-methyl-5-hydroxy-6-metoxy-1,4-benzoquinol methylase
MYDRLHKNPLGFWEVSEKPSKQELASYYSQEYYQKARGSYEHEYSDEELLYFKNRLVLRKYIVDSIISPGHSFKKFLEVGCGEGFALNFFRAYGYSIVGLDFSEAGIINQNPECRDSLILGDVFDNLEMIIETKDSYDILWLQNVLEHVVDPCNLLRQLRSIISHKSSGGGYW